MMIQVLQERGGGLVSACNSSTACATLWAAVVLLGRAAHQLATLPAAVTRASPHCSWHALARAQRSLGGTQEEGR